MIKSIAGPKNIAEGFACMGKVFKGLVGCIRKTQIPTSPRVAASVPPMPHATTNHPVNLAVPGSLEIPPTAIPERRLASPASTSSSLSSGSDASDDSSVSSWPIDPGVFDHVEQIKRNIKEAEAKTKAEAEAKIEKAEPEPDKTTQVFCATQVPPATVAVPSATTAVPAQPAAPASGPVASRPVEAPNPVLSQDFCATQEPYALRPPYNITARDEAMVSTFNELAKRLGLDEDQKQSLWRRLFNKPGTKMSYFRNGNNQQGRGFVPFQQIFRSWRSIYKDTRNRMARHNQEAQGNQLLAKLIEKNPELTALQAENLGAEAFGRIAKAVEQLSQNLHDPTSILREVLAQCIDPACLPYMYPQNREEAEARNALLAAQASDSNILAPCNEVLANFIEVIGTLKTGQTVGLKHYGERGFGLALWIPTPLSPLFNAVVEGRLFHHARYLKMAFTGTEGDEVKFSLSLNKSVLSGLVGGLISIMDTLSHHGEGHLNQFNQIWGICVAFLGHQKSNTFDYEVKVKKDDLPAFFQAMVDADYGKIVDLGGNPTLKRGDGRTLELKLILALMARAIVSTANEESFEMDGHGHWGRGEFGFLAELFPTVFEKYRQTMVDGEGKVAMKKDPKWRLARFQLGLVKCFFREMFTFIVPIHNARPNFYSIEQSPTDTRSDPQGHADIPYAGSRTYSIRNIRALYSRRVNKQPWQKELKAAMAACPALAAKVKALEGSHKEANCGIEVTVRNNRLVDITLIKTAEKMRNQILMLGFYDHKAAKSLFVETRQTLQVIRNRQDKIVDLGEKPSVDYLSVRPPLVPEGWDNEEKCPEPGDAAPSAAPEGPADIINPEGPGERKLRMDYMRRRGIKPEKDMASNLARATRAKPPTITMHTGVTEPNAVEEEKQPEPEQQLEPKQRPKPMSAIDVQAAKKEEPSLLTRFGSFLFEPKVPLVAPKDSE
ncbi:MAG: hypothetical protein KTR20_10625 [Cellvibrionaceae bacterium]|nr:hypothetical protein [Cellvibrionaceae bacterium]